MLKEELYACAVDAVRRGDLTTLHQLAVEYKSLSRRDSIAADDLSNLLRTAIQAEQNDVVELLLTIAGVDVGKEDADGRRAVHVAAETGNSIALRLLIRAGSALNSVDRNGSSPLHFSLLRGYRDISLMLIESGAAVNRPRRYDTGEAPLHAAARLGDATIMLAALRRGAGRTDLHAADGTTPLHIAARERHAGCVDLLCSAASKSAVNASDNRHLTALHCAVQSSALDVVRVLLRYGANPNAVDRSGLTPLHYAAAVTHPPTYSHAGVVDLLIAHGASVHLRDQQKRTPLHLAAAVGNTALVRVLLDAGVEVDAVETILGETALNIAAAYGRHEVMQALCEAGCDVNIPDRHGVAPLYKLLSTAGNASLYKYELADLLLRHGARVNMTDDRGVTPLQACVFHSIISRTESDGLSILRRLAAAGALLQPSTHVSQRSMRNSPLCWLTWHSELTAAAFLVNAGWQLRDERWIMLPGKSAAIESFLSGVRETVTMPSSLRVSCRAVIRNVLRDVARDRDIVPLIECLPLPKQIQRYLTFDSEHDHFY